MSVKLRMMQGCSLQHESDVKPVIENVHPTHMRTQARTHIRRWGGTRNHCKSSSREAKQSAVCVLAQRNTQKVSVFEAL